MRKKVNAVPWGYLNGQYSPAFLLSHTPFVLSFNYMDIEWKWNALLMVFVEEINAFAIKFFGR